MMIDREQGFTTWLDCLTFHERLALKAWYSNREDNKLEWDAFLRSHYEEVVCQN